MNLNPLEILTNPPILHAITVHFPVALAILGVPLVYLCIVIPTNRDVLRWLTAACYLTLLGFAFLAVQTGERAHDVVLSSLSAEAGSILDRHEDMAKKVWMFAGVTTGLLVLSAVRIRWFRPTMVGLAMLTSLATGIWVGMTGHYGGTLVYMHGLGTPSAAVIQKAPVPLPAPEETAPALPPAGAPPAAEVPTEPSSPQPQSAVVPPTDDGFRPAARPLNVEEASRISYVRDIRPILQQHCEKCHSGDEPRGGYAVTSVATLLRPNEQSLPRIIPGKPDDSLLIQRVRGIIKPQMPKGGDPISEDELHLLRQWISAGARDDTSPGPSPSQNSTPILGDALPTSGGRLARETSCGAV